MTSFFKEIDLFDKLENTDGYRKGTNVSVCLSVLLTTIGSFLVIFQFFQYFYPIYIRELSIKPTNRNEAKLVNISLTVLVDLPCFFLHLDSLDSLGFNQININTTASFIRISHTGKELNRSKYFLTDLCQPCYGLLPDSQCCNTCEKLMAISAMQQKVPTPEKWAQCNNKKVDIPTGAPNEKCLIKGKITVNKVPGVFHIAPGSNVKGVPGHMHDLSYLFPHYNLSHSIQRLYFGPKVPSTSNPLINVRTTQKNSGMMTYRYNMMVTPIKFYKNGKFVTKSFEYTAISSSFPIRAFRGIVPGIFFLYSFNPYTITVNAINPSLIHTISSTAGLISGLFAIASFIDLVFNKPEETKEL